MPSTETAPKAKLSSQIDEVLTALQEIVGEVRSQHVQRAVIQVVVSNEENRSERRGAVDRERSLIYGPKSLHSYHNNELLDPRERAVWAGKSTASETSSYDVLAVAIVGSADIGGEKGFLKSNDRLGKDHACEIFPQGTVVFEVTTRVPAVPRFLPPMTAGTYEDFRIIIDASDSKTIADIAAMLAQNGTTAASLREAFKVGLNNYRDNLAGKMKPEFPVAPSPSVNELLSELSLPPALSKEFI